MSTVIALVGRKGSGKSTLARAIKAVDPEFKVCAFATPLKALGVRLLGLDRECTWGPSDLRERKVAGSDTWDYWQRVRSAVFDDRENIARMFPGQFVGDVLRPLVDVLDMLQGEAMTLGGVTHRRVLEAVGTDWGRALDDTVWVRQFLAMLGNADRVVVDDARFPNEVRAVQAAGGRAYYLDAGDRLPELDPRAHASEPRPADFRDIVDGVLDVSGADPDQAETHALTLLRDNSVNL